MSILKEVNKNKRIINLNLKLAQWELDEIKKNAEKYAGGNLSAWVRYAAMKTKPAKKELQED